MSIYNESKNVHDLYNFGKRTDLTERLFGNMHIVFIEDKNKTKQPP